MKTLLLLAAGWALFAAGPLRAADIRHSMLVSTAWLAENLKEPNLVVLHVGEAAEYEAGHVPGARHLPLEAVAVRGGGDTLTLELLPVQELKQNLEARGVSDNSRVVLYYGKDRLTAAARVWMTLDYLGLGDRAAILDGGLTTWQAENRPVTTEVPAPARGSLTPRVNPNVIASQAWVQSNLRRDGVAVVDSRLPQFHEGRDPGRMKRAGRIPGARNIPFASITASDTKLKDAAALRQLFQQAGVRDGDTVVTYCHIGLQASLGYFTARYLGHDAKLYDGSFDEWSRKDELPIETSQP